MNLTASADIANRPPTACMGLDPRPNEIPEVQRSAPVVLLAIGPTPFRAGDDSVAPHAGPPTCWAILALPRNAGRPSPDSLRRPVIVTHATSEWSKTCTTVIEEASKGPGRRTGAA